MWTTKTIRPASLFQSGRTLLLSAGELHKLKQGEAFLELDTGMRHDRTVTYVLTYPPRVVFGKRAG
jgi:hypothetical protein